MIWIFMVCSILIWCSHIINKNPIISSLIDERIIYLSQWDEEVQKELLYMRDIQHINLDNIRYNSLGFFWDKDYFYKLDKVSWEVVIEPIERKYLQTQIKESIANGEYQYR
jgi:hypothetical protein